MKVAIYARTSLSADRTEDARYQEPENQLLPLRQMAQGMGFDIHAEYVDRVSGATSDRPQFLRLRMDAHQRKFQILLIWSLDRFSREGIPMTFFYIEELKRCGVGIISHQEPWLDTRQENPFSDVIIAIFAWVAKQERLRISQRTRAGIAQRRAIGQWHGGRPIGSKDKRPRKRRPSIIKGEVSNGIMDNTPIKRNVCSTLVRNQGGN